MKATVYRGPGDVRVEDIPDPDIEQPTDAVVRVTHAYVCGSDLWFYRGIQNYEEGTEFFSQRRPLLRAIADASAGDQEVERLYRTGFIDRFVGAVATRVKEGIEAKEMPGQADPEQVARALVWMSERYWLETFGREP